MATRSSRRVGCRGTPIRLGVFLSVTFLWTWVFSFRSIADGEITAVTALGGMWGPFVGVLATRLVFPGDRRRGTLAGLGWRWGQTRWQLISFFLPAAYVGLVYGAIWALGLGRLEDAPVVDQAVMVLTWMAGGATIGAFLAFGEEVGWQGFLVPEVSAITTFARTSLTRGLIWSVWHYPLIVGGVYGPTETPLWYRLVCFTTTMTAVSFAFTWLRIRSGSLWTGVWLHASHNVFFQEIYPNLTTESDSTMWYVDEFGAFSALAAVLVAIVFWSRRADLASDGEGAQSTEIEQARAIADTGTRLETTVPRR